MQPTTTEMADGTSKSESNANEEPIWSFDPFDRSLIRLPAKELNSVFSYIAVHGTPSDFTYEGRVLMYWELVCVYRDVNEAVPTKTVAFSVKGRPTKNWFEPYIRVYSETKKYDDTVDPENFWWKWPLSSKILGNIASFQGIIDLLEEKQNRYEKLYVNGQTLEGTFLWVKEIVRLLEERDLVRSSFTALGLGMKELSGESMVAADLEINVMEWMNAYSDVYYCL